MPKNQSFVAGAVETVKTVVYAVLIALVARSFAIEPFNIPSGSMVPTLLVGDYLFVSKYTYGYSRHSFPLSLPPFSGRIFGSDPKQGDVVVFKFPVPGHRDAGKDYIKRIVALPGDRVKVSGGVLHLNGRPVLREPLGVWRSAPGDADGAGGEGARIYAETLPSGAKHRILEFRDNDALDNTPEYLVPAGHFFAMGDNRDNSADSRAGGWFVPFANIVGRAEFIFYSHDGSAGLLEVWNWPGAIRFERLFTAIR